MMKKTAAAIISVILLCMFCAGLTAAETVKGTEAAGAETAKFGDIQYVLYLGTNDKDTNTPVFTQTEAMEKAREILIRHFGGYTIQEAHGGWIDNEKEYQEYTLVIYLSDTTLDQVHAAANEMIETFRQSSVLIQENPTQTEFYTPQETADRSTAALLSEYWTEGSAAAESLNDYLRAVTDEKSPDFIPVDERIAVFDLDGTLMCETYPFCFEYMVFADYALHSGSDTITDEVRAVAQEIVDAAGKAKPNGMSTRQARAGAIAYRGMTMDEVAEMVAVFKGTEAWGFSGMIRGDAFYKPMVELFEKLQQNGFSVYVVTATERNIVRELIAGTLDIPPSHVIGTEYGYTTTGQGDAADPDYTFQPSDRIVFDGSYYGENAKTSKVDAIVREIGQQPVLAFGNSSGDLAMEIYTISNNPRRSAAYMVMADDEEREYGDAAGAAEKAKAYSEQGIGIISMRDDFKTIYGDDVIKVEMPQAEDEVSEPAA